MSNLKSLYHVAGLPLFQNKLFATEEEARTCACGDIDLVQDERTGLVFNAAFRPELLDYDLAYDNEQSLSPRFQQHLAEVITILEQEVGRDEIVEVGCGKGYFLEQLEGAGFDVLGVDPTYEGQSPKVIKEYFRPDLGVRGKALVLRHVLEHIANPYAFLKLLRDANGGGGLIYIEVPCLEWIQEHKAWFDVFYEHVNYFRMADFMRLFGDVRRAEKTFGRQYLSIVADLASLREPVREPDDHMQFPESFAASIENKPRMPYVIWGGGSKGVIFSLLMSRAGFRPDAVIDINQKKQGRYLPVTGLKIMPPNVLADLPRDTTVYVMNGNYLAEIQRETQGRFACLAIDE
jgi:SAM-dependent methyltransferase